MDNRNRNDNAIEKKAITNLIDNEESTMKAAVSASVGKVLLRLADIFQNTSRRWSIF